MSMPIAFSGNPLDRDDRLRTMPDILDRARNGQIMLFIGDRVMTDAVGQPVWYSWDSLPATEGCDFIFLGRDKALDDLCYALRARADHPAYISYINNIDPDEMKPRDARGLAMKVGPRAGILGMIAQAKSLLDWHETHQHCAQCGGKTEMAKGGYQRNCPSCGAEHYPRTDPVIITLAVHGQGDEAKALLGRGPKMPPGFFSALAGFVEPGETLEEAVIREMREEAGIEAYDITYIASQPWPWPSSLMIGCMARTNSLSLQPDMDEIDELHWLGRAELVEALKGGNPGIALPPPMAIAHQLIRHFIEHPEL